MQVPDFERTRRVTLLPVINAAENTGPPLFIFKGASLPYHKVLVEVNVHIDTYNSHLIEKQ